MPNNTNVNRGTDSASGSTDTNTKNQQRIAELQRGESEGRLTDEEAAELQRLQQETSAE